MAARSVLALTRVSCAGGGDCCDGSIGDQIRQGRRSEHRLSGRLASGDVDLILVPQWLSNIEQYWEHPEAAYFLRRIASFGRLIMFDKRGTGLSDPVPDAPRRSRSGWTT